MASAAETFRDHDHGHCVAAALAAAEAACAGRGLQLTRARKRVLEILLESHRAIGAYDLLERLVAEGRSAQPPTVYRALAFLTDQGFAHRIERLNAYIACARPGCAHDPAFLICRGCGMVAESDARQLAPAAGGFRIDSTVVEAQGLCPACQAT